MSYFRYKIIRKDGQLTSGVIDLPYQEELPARTVLENQGGTVLLVHRLNFLYTFFYNIFDYFFGSNLHKGELADFLHNISLMLRTGIPILSALEDSISFGASAPLKKIVEDISFTVESGRSFSDALERHPRVFSESIRFLARIGEETGTLDRTLDDAAVHIDRIQKVKGDTKRAFIYPAFVFLTVIGAAIFWIKSVVPNMMDLFKQMRIDTPPITLFLLDISNFLEEYLLLMSIAFILFIVLFRLLIFKNKNARYHWHHTLLYLPVIKHLTLASSMAYITEYFSLLVTAGVDILTSLKVLSEATPNEYYRRKIIDIRRGLENGNLLVEEFHRTKIFPSLVVRMIGVGEQSGTLGEQLSHIATEYRHRFSNLIDNLSELIKPLVILFVGGLFAFIIAALFLPIYTMIGQIGQT